MPKKANEQNMQELKRMLEATQGKKAGTLARMLGWSREKVNRGLATLNDEGVLLYEDSDGHLYPFRDELD
ncbi:hypothetical protein FBQ82_13770 [Anaerolineae bacterium CFX7]|nr:hypothetical protein [Anaerolineae bacterium CFX7]